MDTVDNAVKKKLVDTVDNIIVSAHHMEDKIGELVSVLGVDSKAAKNLLEASGGNLEMAVNMHLEGGGPATLFETRDYNKTYEEM